jgi:hypothetical protein
VPGDAAVLKLARPDATTCRVDDAGAALAGAAWIAASEGTTKVMAAVAPSRTRVLRREDMAQTPLEC